MSTRVVHISDNVPGAVYVGRAVPRRSIKGSKWGNPFGVRRHGRAGTIRLYRHALEVSGSIPLIADLPELRNAPALACWCRGVGEERTPENECHADVLIDLLERYTDDELRALRTIEGDSRAQDD